MDQTPALDAPRLDLLARVSRDDAADGLAARRFRRLLEIVDALGSCVLALSGGIDSTFLLAVAAPVLGTRCLALTAESAAVPVWDRDDAAAAAENAAKYGARWRTVSTKELDDPRYARNPRSRCYFCKAEMYGEASQIAQAEGYAWVVDGTNASDLERGDRPGLAASTEFGVRSPLAEAEITKAQVRALARAVGVQGWNRPASACLASRIPFGERITVDRLRRVETAELAIRGLGFSQVRVRDFGTHARVEVDPNEFAALAGWAAFVQPLLDALGYESWSPATYTGSGAGDSVDASR